MKEELETMDENLSGQMGRLAGEEFLLYEDSKMGSRCSPFFI